MTSSSGKLVVGLSLIVVASAIGYGLLETGGPGQQRKERMDNLKISRISALSGAIERYYKKEETLPDTLNTLTEIDTYQSHYLYDNDALNDPETEAQFEYKISDSNTYQLCSTFKTDTVNETRNKRSRSHGRYYYGYYSKIEWQHPKGQHCFTKNIKIEKNNK